MMWSMTTSTTPALSIKTVTIPVLDQDRALAFYRDVLGFEVLADQSYGDARWLTVAPAGSPVDFTLHKPFEGGTAGWQQGIVLHTADIAGVVAVLRQHEVQVADPEAVGWGVQTTFADPDGNGFVLLQQGPTTGSWGAQ